MAAPSDNLPATAAAVQGRQNNALATQHSADGGQSKDLVGSQWPQTLVASIQQLGTILGQATAAAQGPSKGCAFRASEPAAGAPGSAPPQQGTPVAA
eukprot:4341416-Pyramimonas_sp.AAC.1